ncbi:MAG: N-6 DNA methylase, partial [Fimbriimonadales bacterium]|nr:N-6 DNA methylase [Fimbriimonadales bacterium]
TNPFLRRLFQQLAAHDLEPELAWIADDLARLLHNAEMPSILRDFGNRRAKEDPIVHFYEDFLHHYDPALRELRGVYYTPEPVVRFITRAVDTLLQTEFGKPLGVADPNALILDPACGTGSFLYELIEHIHRRVQDAFGAGAWQGYVAQQLLPRLFGFELLVAPYAVAHLKLALQLQQLGYQFQQGQRLGIYLTNTLEQAVKRTELLLGEYIPREANEAAHIKRDKPIL